MWRFPVKNLPELDEGFVPLGLFFRSHQALAKKRCASPWSAAAARWTCYEAKIIGTPEMQEADEYCIDRLVKFLLWSRGGYKVTVCGDEAMAKAVRDAYTDTGARAFDKGFMEQVYERPFTVESAPYENRPQPVRSAESIGRLWTAHASVLTPAGRTARSAPSSTARPCTAKRWSGTPTTVADPGLSLSGHPGRAAHRGGPHPGARPPRGRLGVSSAGVYIDNKCMVASLFLQVSPRGV